MEVGLVRDYEVVGWFSDYDICKIYLDIYSVEYFYILGFFVG